MNLLRNLSRAFLKAVFAGILIGIAGFGYLINPVVGMVLFAAGLAGIVLYGVPLFTGLAGVSRYDNIEVLYLLLILGGQLSWCFSCRHHCLL